MEFNKRRPYVDYKGEPIVGHMQSDHHYVDNNRDLCVAFLNFISSRKKEILLELGDDTVLKITKCN